jgi:membrane protein YdbS with pleckstrin-like domain
MGMEKSGGGIRSKLGKELRPAPQFRNLYFFYFISGAALFFLPWYMPLLLFAPPIIVAAVSLIILPFILFTLYWIPLYWKSMVYKLTRNEMEWKRGVWFRKTGIVPYNRITNIDIAQGPISRAFGIASLKIQTAGYSAPGPGGTASEIRIEGMLEFEDIRELIMSFVRGTKPVAVEAFETEEAPDDKFLRELVRIRKLLEKLAKK